MPAFFDSVSDWFFSRTTYFNEWSGQCDVIEPQFTYDDT